MKENQQPPPMSQYLFYDVAAASTEFLEDIRMSYQMAGASTPSGPPHERPEPGQRRDSTGLPSKPRPVVLDDQDRWAGARETDAEPHEDDPEEGTPG